MFNLRLSFFCLAGLLAISPALVGQAAPTATGGGVGKIQAGFGVLVLNPDYMDVNTGNSNNIGLTAYVDYDFYKFVGLEAEAHFENFITPGDISENTYLVGPRFSYHRRKLTAYAKVVFGLGVITNLENPAGATYFNQYNDDDHFATVVYGGGIEYRIKPHINIRVLDVELQKWGNFEPHTLSPIAYTVGVAYQLR